MNMNFLFKISVICALAFSLFACKKDDNTEDTAPYFGIAANELTQNFIAESDSRYLTVATNQEFTATSSQPWCTVEKVDDKVDNLKISVTENNQAEDRVAEIVVASAGFQSVRIAVKQVLLPVLSVSEASGVLIEDSQLEFTLNIRANLPYTFDLPSWITLKSESVGGENLKTWTFTAQDMTPGIRSGNVTVSSTDEKMNKKAVVPVVQKSHIRKTGSWLFEDATNLIKAAIGNDLTIVKKDAAAAFLSVDGPDAGNKAVRVPLNAYFLADHGMIPKTGEATISEYTLFFEFKIPAAAKFYTFFQTNLANTDDGEIFVRSTNPQTIGVGATGYAGSVQVETWYRLYLSFKPGDVKFFMNGAQFLSSTTSDARFRINPAGVILCGGPWTKKDDNEFDIAEISIWNGALSAEQIQEIENSRQQ
jgi:hypothetical protein